MRESDKKKIIKEYFSEMGKKGGSKGGNARKAALTPAERTAIAEKGAAARWAKKGEAQEKAKKAGGQPPM